MLAANTSRAVRYLFLSRYPTLDGNDENEVTTNGKEHTNNQKKKLRRSVNIDLRKSIRNYHLG